MVCDLHNDILTSGLSDGEIKAYLEGAVKYCDVLTMAAWTTGSKPSLSFLKDSFQKYSEYKNVVFAVEDAGFLRDDDEKQTLKNLEGLFNLQIVYAGLVWNNENCFGGGAFSDAGLTETGKAAVDFFNNQPVNSHGYKRARHLDFAHMNKNTFYAAAGLYRKPILCSHACFDACVDRNAPHYDIARARNLDDGQINLIVQSGGLIGLAFVATFLNGTPHCASGDLVRHIDYFVQKHGCKHLAVGADYFGTKELPADVKEYNDFPILAEKLSRLGYPAAAIESILCNNVKRFLDFSQNN